MEIGRVALFTIILAVLLASVTNFAEAHIHSPDDTLPVAHTGYIDSSINVICDDSSKFTQIDGSGLGGDRDHDSLCDAWESYPGMLYINFKKPNNNTTFEYKLACTTDCPSPTKRDLYVELDWMNDDDSTSPSPNSHAPKATAISDLKTAFNNAPYLELGINYPQQDASDVVPGINLHVQYGEDPRSITAEQGEINFHYNSLRVPGTDLLPGFYAVKTNYFGTAQERKCGTDYLTSTCNQTLQWDSFIIVDRLTAKRQAFHYGLIIHQQYGNSFSGWSEQNGNDFVISLGTFTPMMGSIDQQEGTIMHELGHTLGLRHGGNQDYSCKPNYLSVMSYTFQFAANADSGRPLDFSKVQLNSLNENSLDERDPAINPSYNYSDGTTPRKVYYSSSSGSKLEAKVMDPIDWNGVTPGQQNVQQNINNISSITGCSNTAYTTSLTGYNDWQNLNFDIFAANYGGNGQPSADEGYIGDEVPDEEYGPLTDESEGTGPIGMTMSTTTTYQKDSKGNEIVQSGLNNENQQDKVNKKNLVDPLFFGTEKPVLTHRYSTNGDITYPMVKEFYNLHFKDIGNKINSINDTDFKNDQKDKILLEKYLLDAFTANQKDDLESVSENLSTIKNIATNSIINNKENSDFLLFMDDKINAFDKAQDIGENKPVENEHKKIFDSLTQLNNSTAKLGDSIDRLDDSVSNLADKLRANPGPDVITLAIIMVVGTIIIIISWLTTKNSLKHWKPAHL